MLFILRDFFMSKQGKVLLFSFAIGLAVIYLFQLNSKKEAPAKVAPASRPSVWEDSGEQPDIPIQQSRRNSSFVPFVPKSSEMETAAPKEPLKLEKAKAPVALELPLVIHAPLFKEERAPRVTVEQTSERRETRLPEIELGAAIHCQLLTSAATDSSNSPVVATVTRSLIRDGVTLIPIGSRLLGHVQSSQNNRIFFAPAWQIITTQNKQLSLSGHVQEKGYDPLSNQFTSSDGTLGLPGFIENQQPSKELGKNLLGNVVKGIARLGKETVRTSAGEFIPSTGRNIVIDGSSAIIDGLLDEKEKSPTIKQQPYILIPAGQEFYLVVASTRSTSKERTEEESIDDLLKQAVKKRLQ